MTWVHLTEALHRLLLVPPRLFLGVVKVSVELVLPALLSGLDVPPFHIQQLARSALGMAVVCASLIVALCITQRNLAEAENRKGASGYQPVSGSV